MRRMGRALARNPVVQGAALRTARHSLVLLYHRVGKEAEHDIVPTVSADRLDAHLSVLQASGRIVPLAELLVRPHEPGPRFAVTFDDDYTSHTRAALPVLTAAGAEATFFLCGRSLHGLGASWWERLEALVVAEGGAGAAARLGFAPTDGQALAPDLESDPDKQRRIAELSPEASAPLVVDEIRELAAAGMEIGFHTLHHPLLTALDDARLERALLDGRDALAAVAGQPLEHFAYPHGKADRRTAAAVERAGYRAAWTGWPAPHRPSANRYLLPRWEPGRIAPDRFASALAVRLHRTAKVHREALRG